MTKKDRMDKLLLKAATALENGVDPFNREFLVANEVSADECMGLSEKMGILIKGFLGADRDDQVMLLAVGAVYNEGPEMVKIFRGSLKMNQATKRLKALH